MSSLRKFEALLFSEQPLNEPVQLFSADEGYMGELSANTSPPSTRD